MDYETVEIIIDEEIVKTQDTYSIIEPVWWSVSIYDGENQYKKDLESFSIPQKYVFAIEWYLCEVNNGGHDQFYFNSTGIVWEDAMKGFEVIGLQENYDIIKESANRLGGYPSKDRFQRQNQLDEYDAEFDDLDTRLYKSEQEIEEALLKYIRDNVKDFLYEGTIKKPVGL